MRKKRERGERKRVCVCVCVCVREILQDTGYKRDRERKKEKEI